MESEIVFYQLHAKVLEREEDVPENARQVMYYSLAIGHHIGVFDCFRPVLRCSASFLDGLIAALANEAAQRKLDGIHRFGEIIIDRTHTAMLGAAIAAARERLDAEQSAWCDALAASLRAIEAEPAIYLMGRQR